MNTLSLKKNLLVLSVFTCLNAQATNLFQDLLNTIQTDLDGLDTQLQTLGNNWESMITVAENADASLVASYNKYEALYTCLYGRFQDLKNQKNVCEGQIASLLTSIDQARSAAVFDLDQLYAQYASLNDTKNNLVTAANNAFGDSQALATQVYNLMQSVVNAYNNVIDQRYYVLISLDSLEDDIALFVTASEGELAMQTVCADVSAGSCASNYQSNLDLANDDVNAESNEYNSLVSQVAGLTVVQPNYEVVFNNPATGCSN